jgi:hypothetical protein
LEVGKGSKQLRLFIWQWSSPFLSVVLGEVLSLIKTGQIAEIVAPNRYLLDPMRVLLLQQFLKTAAIKIILAVEFEPGEFSESIEVELDHFLLGHPGLVDDDLLQLAVHGHVLQRPLLLALVDYHQTLYILTILELLLPDQLAVLYCNLNLADGSLFLYQPVMLLHSG